MKPAKFITSVIVGLLIGLSLIALFGCEKEEISCLKLEWESDNIGIGGYEISNGDTSFIVMNKYLVMDLAPVKMWGKAGLSEMYMTMIVVRDGQMTIHRDTLSWGEYVVFEFNPNEP